MIFCYFKNRNLIHLKKSFNQIVVHNPRNFINMILYLIQFNITYKYTLILLFLNIIYSLEYNMQNKIV